MKPTTKDAYNLLHEGILALSDIENKGIHIDVDYCKKQITYMERKIKRLLDSLDKTDEIKIWRKTYGNKFKIDSNQQLAHVLFEVMDHVSDDKTESGMNSVAGESLNKLKIPMVKDLIQYRKYMKAKNTYLQNFLDEVGDGHILHPFFSLHTARTYRSSSSNPNWQNIPVRDPEIKKIVRRAIIARPNHHIVEIDFVGAEVRVSASLNGDPQLLKYINDPTTDMHRDICQECYILGDDEWTKQTRYQGKSSFVFPQFYGDYYKNCAKHLWDAIETDNLVTVQKVPLKEHLQNKGIGSYLSFEKHIRKIEDNFWNNRFKVYTQWKKKRVREYERDGHFDLITGFRCTGLMRRNEILNYQIQGPAFHCLLWCLIQAHKILLKKGLRSCIIGQIHDSLLIDIHHNELEEVIQICKQVMSTDLNNHYKWLKVLMEIEIEASPINGSWYEKNVMEA